MPHEVVDQPAPHRDRARLRPGHRPAATARPDGRRATTGPTAPGTPTTSRARRTVRRRGRALLVLVAAAGLGATAAAVATAVVPVLLGAPGPATGADDVLVAAAGVVAALLAGTWSVAAALAAVAALLPDGSAAAAGLVRVSRALAPTLLRAVLVAGLGAGPVAAAVPALAATPVATAPATTTTALPTPSVSTPSAATATARPTSVPAPVVPGSSTPEGVAVAPGAPQGRDAADGAGTVDVPDVSWRPAAPPRPQDTASAAAGALMAPAPRPPAAGETVREVVVVRGDTLWDIARRALPADADDGEVASAWPAWFEANRHVVGDDPDLLLPGQRLVAPAVAP